MKRRMAFLLAFILILSLVISACGTGPDAATPNVTTPPSENAAPETAAPAENAGPKELVVSIGPDTESIDPALNTSVNGGNMLLFSFDCLLAVDKDNKVIPASAESFDVSTDGLTYTFHLREGLKWSDGSPLTAEDFVYSFKRVADPATAAPYAETVLGMVKGFEEAAGGNPDALAVSAPDANTFVVELSRVCPYFDKLAAFNVLAPVNRATIEANGDAWATKPETYICNGPFYISEWVPSSYVTYTKNPNYWDADAIKLDTLKLLLIEDPNASFNAYETGEAMMVKDLPSAEIANLQTREDYYLGNMLGTYYVCVNNELPQFSDPLVRTALSLAIDRNYIAETIMTGTMTPATGFVCAGVADWDGSDFAANANGGKPYIDNSNFEANLAKAKELLAQAGYPNGEGFPTIHYAINTASFHKPVAEYVQQAWKELGLTVSVDVVEWASFLPQRRAGDYEISRNGWLLDYNDPSNIMETVYSTNGNDDAQYNNPEYDALMDKAAQEADPQARFGYLHQAEDVLMKDMGVIPVVFYSQPYLQSPKITGSWYSASGYWYFQYADVVE